MKKFTIVCVCIAAVFLSSCTVFVLNEEEHAKKDHGDTISITITHNIEDNQQ